jgi:uncharacterized OB-fold protein
VGRGEGHRNGADLHGCSLRGARGSADESALSYAFIKLDGADTSVAHFLSETDIDKIRNGMHVEAVFEEKRKGSLLDIKHFAPIGE